MRGQLLAFEACGDATEPARCASSRPGFVIAFFVEENMRVLASIPHILAAPLAVASVMVFSLAAFAFAM